MKLEYDPDVDCAYLTVRRGKVLRSKQVGPGVVLDFDKNGEILGVEVISVRKRANGVSGKSTRRAQLATAA